MYRRFSKYLSKKVTYPIKVMPIIIPIIIHTESIFIIIEPVLEISNNVVCATNKASDQPAHTRSLIRAFASRLRILRLLSY